MACCNRRRAQLAYRSPGGSARTGGTARPGSAAPGTGTPGNVAPGAGTPGNVAPGAGTSGTVAPGGSVPGAAEVALRFTGARRVRVEGVVSGRIYHASPTAPLLSARPEDVRSLLRSGLFVRA